MMKDKLAEYREEINALLSEVYTSGPESLIQPVQYVLAGGGKRLRPLLTLITADTCCGNANIAMPAAIAVEVLHNFTLVHDDIMDDDVIRHGQPTVHEKWDVGSAILTGDAMVSLALKMLLKSENNPRELLTIFTEGLLRVCEGQALDKEFETRDNVTIAEYVQMIDLKTGHLLGLAAELGAISSNASPSVHTAMRDYARLVGRAFQVQDDLLEVYSDSAKMGKSLKSDLFLNKKTYLMLQAVSYDASATDSAIQTAKTNHEDGLNLLRELLDSSGIKKETTAFIDDTIKSADDILRSLEINTDKLHFFSSIITNRKN
ncbi:MAG: polyprenyl synthetase family protein [FCB group bacterium]|nr:polyprenyl synthetase family protein [FCB group bacterium]